MHCDIQFTNEQVVEFCRATRDLNTIHNPEYMTLKGKHVVVPGMFLFALVVDMLYTRVGRTFDSFRVYFNSVISTGEKVKIGYDETPRGNGERFLFAMNGRDSFAVKDERSRVYRRDWSIGNLAEGHYRNMAITPGQYDTFKRLVGCHDDAIAGFLFAVAYASPALARTINEPITESEKEINRLLDKAVNPDRVSPFYQSLDIYLPEKPETLTTRGEINYRVHFVREKLNRVYIAHVQCEQEGRVIYRSEYKLIAIPDRLILRMAKDLAVSPVASAT